jgi:class 3 adenylate cyclase
LRQGKTNNAIEELTEALSLAELVAAKDRIISIVVTIGNAYLNLSRHQEALEYHEKALTISRETHNKRGECQSLGNIGIIHNRTANYAEAIGCYNQAIEIAEEIGYTIGVSNYLGSIGITYYSLQQYDRALEFYHRALGIVQELDNKERIGLWYGNIANTYIGSGNLNAAEEYCDKAIAIDEELGDKPGLSFQLARKGNVKAQQKDFRGALEVSHRCLELAKEIGYVQIEANVLLLLGDVWGQVDNPERDVQRSIEYSLRGLEMSRTSNNIDDEIQAHDYLAELYAETGEFEKAYLHAREYSRLHKEVQGEEVTKSVQEQTIKFHEREVKILNEKNAEIAEAHQQLEAVHQQSEELLLNILPQPISERLKSGEELIADSFHNVSIFFSDIVSFTAFSHRIAADELVRGLNEIVTHMDRLAKFHGLEKIKTIGDAYMAVCGVPEPRKDHAECAVKFALDVARFMESFRMTITDEKGNKTEEQLQIRIGLHAGDVVAGIIGENKFSYDLWGDAVNTAARMESSGEPSKVHVSEDFVKELRRVAPTSYSFTKREPMEIKGKGMMQTYFVDA